MLSLKGYIISLMALATNLANTYSLLDFFFFYYIAIFLFCLFFANNQCFCIHYSLKILHICFNLFAID